MIRHPSISVLVSAAGYGHALEPVLSYLESVERIRLTTLPRVPEDLSPYDVVMTGTEAVAEGGSDALTRFVQQGGGWMGLFGGAAKPLPELFGAQPTPAGPASELRVMFRNAEHPLACRLPDAVYLRGLYQALETTAEDTETLLYADWRYQHSAVLVSRSVGAGRVACTTLQDYGHPGFQQILYRILLDLAGRPVGDRVLGVGLLGYSPLRRTGPWPGNRGDARPGPAGCLRPEPGEAGAGPEGLPRPRDSRVGCLARRGSGDRCRDHCHAAEYTRRSVPSNDGCRKTCGLREAPGTESRGNGPAGRNGRSAAGASGMPPEQTLGCRLPGHQAVTQRRPDRRALLRGDLRGGIQPSLWILAFS